MVADAEGRGEKDDDAGRDVAQYGPLGEKRYTDNGKNGRKRDNEIARVDSPNDNEYDDGGQIDKNGANTYDVRCMAIEARIEMPVFADECNQNGTQNGGYYKGNDTADDLWKIWTHGH